MWKSAYFLTLAVSAAFINLDYFQYEPISPLAGLFPFGLMLIGIACLWFGSMRLAAHLFTVVGILIFFLIGLLAAFPTEDYVLGRSEYSASDDFQQISTWDIGWRVAVVGLMSGSLFGCYRRLFRKEWSNDGSGG
jgi:hypothetical protein